MTEPDSQQSTERHPHGEVRTEVVENHILVLTVDRTEKKNALTPKIMEEISAALTRLDEIPELFVGVLTFAGDHTTAGLEMPLFFAPEVQQEQAERHERFATTQVDPFGLGRRLRKPLITAIQGITFTIGIEIALAGDIVIAASDARLCQMEPKRGIPPLGGATLRYVERAGWGNAMYHLLLADEFTADEAYRIGLVQEVVEPGQQRERAIELGRQMLQVSPIASIHTIANARLAATQGEQAAIDAIAAMSEEARQSEDFREGIASFMERRPAQFRGR